MLTAAPLTLGPYPTNDQLWAALAANAHFAGTLVEVDELFRYDAVRIAIHADPAGGTWLMIVVDDGETDGRRASIVHYLPFADEALLRATLHDGMLPTLATYQAAGPVFRAVFSHSLATPRDDFRYESRTWTLSRLPEDELPYAHLRPGALEVHGPFADYGDEMDRSVGHAMLPDEEDRTIVLMDHPRNWFVSRPKGIHPLALVACIRDDAQGYVQHRLLFSNADGIEDTMAAGQAPTLDTYRLATTIRRETVVGDAPDIVVQVETLSVGQLGDEAPTYESRAAHDAEWPQFAAKDAG